MVDGCRSRVTLSSGAEVQTANACVRYKLSHRSALPCASFTHCRACCLHRISVSYFECMHLLVRFNLDNTLCLARTETVSSRTTGSDRTRSLNVLSAERRSRSRILRALESHLRSESHKINERSRSGSLFQTPQNGQPLTVVLMTPGARTGARVHQVALLHSCR